MASSFLWCVRAAVLSAAGTLSACEQPGFSSRDGEWDRRRAGPYYVVNAAPDRAVVSALGRQVAITPAEGFCLAEESLETSGRSAFALIGDCALEDGTPHGNKTARGELRLPKGVPGIITISISGDPEFGSDGEDHDALEAFIASDDGKRLLGRSGNLEAIKVLETKHIGDAVYVLIEDGGDPLVPVLAPQFWRAFTSLNDRLAVVTASGFRMLPLGNDKMLEYLVSQVETLAEANIARINEEPDIDYAKEERPRGEPTLITSLEPETVVIAAAQPEPSSPEPSTPETEEEAPVEAKVYDSPEPLARPGASGSVAPVAEQGASPAESPAETLATGAEAPTVADAGPVSSPEAEAASEPEVVAVAPQSPPPVAPRPEPVSEPEPATPEAEAPEREASQEPSTPPTANAPEEAPEAPPRPS